MINVTFFIFNEIKKNIRLLDQTPDKLLGIPNIRNPLGRHAHFERRIVVSARKHGVSDEDNFVEIDSRNLHEFPNAIGLVDSFPRDVDGRRSSEEHVESPEIVFYMVADFLPLSEIRIVHAFKLVRRLLSEHRDADLRSAVLHHLSPYPLRSEIQILYGLLEDLDYVPFFLFREIQGVLFFPVSGRIPVHGGRAGGTNVQVRQHFFIVSQKREHLRLEELVFSS